MVKRLNEKKLVAKPGNPLLPGVQRTELGYNFTAVVNGEEEVWLLIYQNNSDKVIEEFLMPLSSEMGAVRTISIEGLVPHEYEYNYRMGDEIVHDPYACALTGRSEFAKKIDDTSAHQVRAKLVERPEPSKLGRMIAYEDMILYKLHARGFTKHETAKVKNGGTFSGIQEKIPYLKDLGVTSIELMPAYDFDECPKSNIEAKYQTPKATKVNYWGYAKGFYFAPKASYCATDNPVNEFAELVRALHAAGIECLMEFYFPTEVPITFIIDVLRFWKLWYQIDGFHLVGRDIPIEVIAADPLLGDVKVLYVGFDINKIYNNKIPKVKTLAEYNLGFQENFRRFLKGDKEQLSGITWHLKHNPKSNSVINYMTSQDGFTLADMVSYETRHNEANGEDNRDGTAYNNSRNYGVEGPSDKAGILAVRHRQMKNAIWFMMVSQGVPMIYAGDEMANSQEGNNNAYCQDNEIGWTNWSESEESIKMHEFVKAAIAFRKEHRILHATHEVEDTDYKALGIPEVSFHGKLAWVVNEKEKSQQIGILYCGEYERNANGKPDEYLYIAFNMSEKKKELALPHLPRKMKWEIAVDSSTKGGSGIYQKKAAMPVGQDKKLVVPARTVMILKGK